MNIYMLYQRTNTGYDTYNAVVVCAKDEETAKTIHPCHYGNNANDNGEFTGYSSDRADNISQVSAKFIGEAKPGTEEGIVLASFNAG